MNAAFSLPIHPGSGLGSCGAVAMYLSLPQFCFRDYGRGFIKTGQLSAIKAELVMRKL